MIVIFNTRQWEWHLNPITQKKTDDLYNAYYFAQNHNLNEQSLASANALLANNTVQNDKLGKLRTQQMYVTTNDGRIEYVAESIFYLKSEMEKWCHDLAVLLSQDMNITEVFYYASYLYHRSI